jgi:beta-lactamase regulating signal transducer with metallopeptidase domain/predicted  nucleic acid-binding Zn-ribbon protein
MTILLLLVKASVVLSATLAAAWLLRASSAAARHALWSSAFAALLLMPLLSAAVPALDVPVPSEWAVAPVHSTVPAGAVTARGAAAPVLVLDDDGSRDRDHRIDRAEARAVNRRTWPSRVMAAGLAWLAGAAAAIIVLLLSLFRAARLARSAEVLSDEGWRRAAEALAARLGMRRTPRVLVSGAVRTPMAGGVFRPTIFLPVSFASWTAECRDVVLAHELSHLSGRDPLRHVAARLAVACYWFHPLAWVAARQSTLAREQACDEAVLALGVRPSEYARVLLEIAESLTSPVKTAAALPMVERSLLEKRVMAILDHDVRPSRLRHPFVFAAGAAVLVLSIAAARPIARTIPPGPSTPPAASAPLPSQTIRSGDCWSDEYRGSFSGTSTSRTDAGGHTVVSEMIGTRDGDRIIQTHFGDVRVCMIAQGAVGLERAKPSEWSAPRISIESRRGAATQQMEIRGSQITWRVNGADRAVDAAAQQWRAAMLAALDQAWDISTLRGEVSTLRGEISTIRGDESTLRGQISTLQGEVSTMRGRQSTLRGDESSLRGEISTIEGHVSTLGGQISTERGAISSLQADRYGLTDADRNRVVAQIRDHEAAIDRLEREIRDYDAARKIAAVEKRIQALHTDGEVASIDDDIRRFDLEGKTAAVERQIQALDVDGKTSEIERRIAALDADRRTSQMENRLDEAVKRLEQAIAAIR